MHLKSSNDKIPAFGFSFSKTELPAVLGLWTVVWEGVGLYALGLDGVGVIDLREVVCVVLWLLTVDLDGVGVDALLGVDLIGGLVILLNRWLLRAI